MLILLQRLLAQRMAPLPYRPLPPRPAAAVQPQHTAIEAAAVEPATAYWVYTNSRNRYSRIHDESCPWYQRPRRASQTDNGWWHGPYDRRDLAEVSPQNIGAVAPCGHCLP
jgi:hypothetical protein